MSNLLLASVLWAGVAQLPSPSQSNPIPIDPFISCSWRGFQPANQNVLYQGFGYAGVERGYLIRSGNYNSVGDYLEYTIEVMWNLGDCTGTTYRLRFPDHQINNHVEIEVRSNGGALMGRLETDRGDLPVLYNQNNVALPTNKLGPFVITNSMVGGASGVAETITFTLMDANILGRLPPPVFLNGVAPVGAIQQATLTGAYDDLITEYEYLYSFFTFRRMLGGLNSTQRADAADAIDEHIYELGPIHGDLFWEEHHHIDHNFAVASTAGGTEFGGFFNGHRNYLADLERDLRDQSRVIAFRRVPAWDPNTTIPTEFDVAINDVNGGSDLGSAYQAANICANYDSALSGAATMAARLAEMEEALYVDVEAWHNGVHSGIGGDMGLVSTAARAPIFHPWHTTVDTIWRNWQLCQAAWYPNRYSWDQL